jgi:hypothetical protein
MVYSTGRRRTRGITSVLLGLAALAALLIGASGQAGPSEWTTAGPEGGFVTDIAIDPEDGDTVYASTEHHGLWKSTDGAQTWQPAANLASVFGLGISDSGLLYAADNDRLLVSADGGAKFEEVPADGLPPLSCNALAVAGETVYVGGSHGVARFEPGEKPELINTGLPENPVVISMAVDPTDHARLYVGTPDGPYFSTNGGDSWEAAIEGGVGIVWAIAFDPFATGDAYAFIDCDFYARPAGAEMWELKDAGNCAFTLTPDPTAEGVFYAGGHGEVLRTINHGEDWASAPVDPRANASATALSSDDPETLYISFRGAGVWKSEDGAESVERSDAGMLASHTDALAADPHNDGHLLTSSSGDGVYVSDEDGDTWRRPQSDPADLFDITFSPTEEDLVFGVSNVVFYRSFDGGETWQSILTPNTENGSEVEAAPGPSPRLYILTFHEVLRSDGGEEWEIVLSDEGGSGFTDFALAPSDPDTLYLSTYAAEVRVSTNGGDDWDVYPTPAGVEWFEALQVDPEDPESVWAAGYWGLYHSVNRGQDWLLVDGAVYGETLQRDPEDAGRLYAGSSSTLWTNGWDGGDWVRLTDRLPTQRQVDLAASESSLHVAFMGAGVWSYTTGAQDLFEGWNQTAPWTGPHLESAEQIVAWLDHAVVPAVWQAVAYYDGQAWQQTFVDAPLPALNTLTEMDWDASYWVFGTQDSELWPGLP